MGGTTLLRSVGWQPVANPCWESQSRQWRGAGGQYSERQLHTDINKRFVDYTGVVLSTNAVARRSPSGGNNTSVLVRVQDTQLAALLPDRYRNRIVIVENTMDSPQLVETSIDWEINRSVGRAKVLTVQVDSWRDREQQLWEINSLIPIDIPALGLRDELWLLSEVVYQKDAKERWQIWS